MATKEGKSKPIFCSLHSNQKLELYCIDHEAVLCKMCKLLKHRRCEVGTLTVAFQNEVVDYLKDVPTQTLTLRKELLASKEKIQSLIDQSIEGKADAGMNIEAIRKGLNGILDRYKEQLNVQLKSKTEALAVTMQTYESLSDQLENKICNLEKGKGKGLQEIVSLIEAKHLFRECKDVKEEMDKGTKQVRIRIKEDEMLPELLQRLKSIGKHEVTESEEDVNRVCDIEQQTSSFMNIKSCTAVQTSTIKLSTDKYVSTITSCCFLADGLVVVCDSSNSTLNVLDEEMKIKFTMLCKSSPKDVACFDDNSFAVLYSNHSFQFIYTKPGIKLQQVLSTNLICYGLESFNKMIYISASKYENMTTSIFGVATFAKNGERVNFTPLIGSAIQTIGSFLSVNIEKSSIYFMLLVPWNNCYFINKLSSKGHGVFSVCIASLKHPTTLISDSVGNLLICDTHTKHVHLVDSKGKVGNALIETDDSEPTSMCLNASKDKLIVASKQKDSSKIVVYKLKYI